LISGIKVKLLAASNELFYFPDMTTDPYAAISDANRRFLLEEIRRSPKTVNELAEGLPISRPAVSQHLKVLLECGLVTVKAMGTKRVYAINPTGFNPLNLWLDQFWS
jgi:DNA-binding transcriptional ArsR family regulator